MAKTKGALFSISSFGQVGKSIIFQRGKAGQVVKSYAIPKDRKSAKQLAVRSAMQGLISEWQNLAAENKAAWEKYSKSRGIGGYSSFLNYNFSEFFSAGTVSEWPPDFGPTPPPPAVPVVETAAASDFTSDAARLNGSLIDLDGMPAVDVFFQWRAVGASEWVGLSIQELTEPAAFFADISGLSPESDFEFRAVAVGEGGAFVFGEVLSFETEAAGGAYDLLVAGADNPVGCNGEYEIIGEYNGYNLYKHKTASIWVFFSSFSVWCIGDDLEAPPFFQYFSRSDTNEFGAYVEQQGIGSVVVSAP